MTKNQTDPKIKKFYFSKDDLDNFKTKDSVAEYINGIIHQDKMLYTQVVILPRLGLPQTTPFRLVDSDGKMALETGKDWVAIEIPSDSKRIKVENEEKNPVKLTEGEGKKSKVFKRVEKK